MAKEKKQLRELSEEELKNVTGGNGYLVYVEPTVDDLVEVTPFKAGTVPTPDVNGECPEGHVLYLGICCSKAQPYGPQ